MKLTFDAQLAEKKRRLAALDTANQQGAQIAQAILAEVHEGEQRLERMAQEIDDMKQYVDDNQHKKLILSIADTLGYTADDGAALQAINEFAATANGNGYTWQNGRFINGDKALSNGQVKVRVEALKREWVELTGATA